MFAIVFMPCSEFCKVGRQAVGKVPAKLVQWWSRARCGPRCRGVAVQTTLGGCWLLVACNHFRRTWKLPPLWLKCGVFMLFGAMNDCLKHSSGSSIDAAVRLLFFWLYFVF